MSIGVAVDSELRWSIIGRAALTSFPLNREIVRTAKHLNLRQRQDFFFARNLDANVAAGKTDPIRWCNRGEDPGNHEVSTCVSHSSTGWPVIRKNFQPKRADGRVGHHGSFERVHVGFAAS